MKEKHCIVHIPNHIEFSGKSGSNVRPQRMVEAFEKCGYHVDFVMGYGKERKKKIKEIKKSIRSGIKYDFMYCESSTMPTLLTEKCHIPLYPTLDFGFYKFCHKYGIKIGLFYRDIQWKFSIYQEYVAWYKKIVATLFYKYDLLKYRNLVDIFYIPSPPMINYLKKEKKLISKAKVLMPGGRDRSFILNSKNDYPYVPLHILYVGGVDRIYDLSVFLEAVKRLGNCVKVTLCCRREEWLESEYKYHEWLGYNINIIHKSGMDLEPFYMEADICCAFVGKGEYMSMAMPVKVFEYLGFCKPILATKGTEAGKFVEENNIGWCIDYSQEALVDTLRGIINNPNLLKEKEENEIKIVKKHTWQARAEQVISDLKQRL